MEKLDKILSQYAAQGDQTAGKVFGAAFVVVNANGVVYQGAAGRVAQAEGSPNFSPDSFSWLASLTKIITITCLMQIVERGHIKLDDDVKPFVPELARMQILRGFDAAGKPDLVTNDKPITLRQLLTHTVGLGYDIVDPDLTKWSRSIGRTTTNLTYTLDGWDTPLKFPPGEGWCYGTAIDWAGQVLEKVTGQPLGQYMKENIFVPLDMQDTTFRPETISHRTKARTVPCSFRDADTGRLSNGPLPIPSDPPIESGGAGLWSTAADHAKVLQALLRASTDCGAETLLGKESVNEMFRPQLTDVQLRMLQAINEPPRSALVLELPPETPLDHGIGGIINMEDVPGKRRRGSMMWLGMCNGHWWIDRETGIAATLVVNVLPLPDSVVNTLYSELEQAVYRDLCPSLVR